MEEIIMKTRLFKRTISALLILCMLAGLMPTVTQQARAATTLVSTSTAPSATATEVDALFGARSEGKHPRILADADKFAEIRQRIQTDDYMKVLYARLYAYGLEQLNEPVSIYEIPDGVRLLSVSRTASGRIMWMAMLFQLSGERRFADRAIAEMLAVSGFNDWHPDHYLDVGQMAYGVGIGYDWLYHYMTEDQRAIVRNALYNYAVKTGIDHTFIHNITSNWNPWCMAGLAVAAGAIYEYYPSDCSRLLAKSVTSIQGSLALFTPLGAYPEGPGYYRLGTEFSAVYFETMKSLLGTDFGLSDLPGVREASKYLLATTGYVNTFNFGDCSDVILDGAVLHWFANRFHMPELSVYQRKFQSRNSELMDEVLALIWYDPDLVEGYSTENQQLDYLMYSDEYQSVASFRSFDADPNQVYAAIKSGYNSTSHADMDIGTFVMEAMGERWFMDMGSDNYNLDGYGKFSNGYADDIGRWTYYRKRTEGHNAIVVNPCERGGQDAKSKAQITDYASSYDGGYATVDMYDAYDSYGVTSANRGLLLFDNRSRVLLRDELTCSTPSEVYWFAHTMAEITISEDGKTAELTQNGKTLLAQISEPSDAVFTVMDAQPLVDYSLKPENEKSREGIRKLAIHLENVISTEISVVFTPILKASDRNRELPNVTLATLDTQLNDYDAQSTLKANSQGVYEIYNVDQLCLLSDMVRGGNNFGGKTFKLMNDIDMQGRTFQPIGGCGPVGGTTNSFNGIFDGNYHTIKNLCIFEPDSEHVGLFGRVHNATIRNLGIEGGIVFGYGKTAGLAGTASRTTIDHCYNKANVISRGRHAGGLVGELGTESVISNSYNNADIKNYNVVSGGLVGYVTSKANVTLSNCYHVGTLTDSGGQNGLIGHYITVSGTYLVGSVTVNNCYATTPIKSSFVADDADRESYTNCLQVTEGELVGKAVALGDAFIADCEWENDGFPVLQWQCDTTLPTGSEIEIRTEAELRLFAHMVNSGVESQRPFDNTTVKLCNDIDLGSREWIPIGGSSPNDQSPLKTFYGTFNGQGYAVKNLKVSTNLNFNGFFGGVNGDVLNFGIKSGSVKGEDKVGGIAGYLGGSGTVDNCYNRASVQGVSFVGGLVGMGGRVAISNCYNTGTITATYDAGGIVGYFSSAAGNASVSNCYNAGALSGNKKGAIVASFHDTLSGIPITNCYALSGNALFYDQSGYVATNCISCTEGELKAKPEGLGNSFANDSFIPENDGYPVLNTSLYGTAAKDLEPDSDRVYNIYTAEQLRSIAYMVNVKGNTFAGKTVRLQADIDLMNKEWIPIGGNVLSESSTRPSFSGTFDGNGHIITNLRITSGNLYVGLFGFASGARIQNVGLENGMVIGKEKVAGLVGGIRGATRVTDCYNKLNISGSTSVGGLVGMIGGSGSSVKNCYNAGTVDAAYLTAAGIVGYVASDGANTVVENCYNLGVQSPGIIGDVNGSVTTAKMTNCYTIDTVELNSTANSLIITNCAKVDAATLRTYVTTLGSAYAEDYLAQNTIFPVLAWQNGDAPTTLTTNAQGVYLINNADELRLLSYLVRKGNNYRNKKFLMTADIDLENKPWLSIGGYLENTLYAFNGSFNGGGHVIHNINAWEMTGGFTGLFGKAAYGVIENLGIESGVIIGKEKVAGIAGNLASGATIQRCYNKATLYGNLHVGGMAGMVNLGTSAIRNCYNTGMVYSRKVVDQSAGLVGYLASDAKNILIENCYDIGNYNTVLCHINNAATGTIIRNTYSVGGVKMVAKALTGAYTLEDGTKLVTPATMKAYHTELGCDFVVDKNTVNQGYPVLAWERSCEIPDTAYLFFDFTNTEKDQLRYARYTYGFTQFDDPIALNWMLASDTGSSVEIDSETDTLILNTEAPLADADWPAAYTDPRFAKGNDNYPLHFDPSEAEYFQVRFKMENFRSGEQVKDGTTITKSPYLKIQYCADGSTKFVNGTSDFVGHEDYIDADEWFVATIPVNNSFKSAAEIQRLRIYFGGMESISAEEAGKVTIDYIYIGSEKDLPGKKNLLFHFSDTPEDQARYDSKTYGYVQFDDEKELNWAYSTVRADRVSIDSENSTIFIQAKGKLDDTLHPDVYIDAYDRKNASSFPLHYDPQEAEYLQIRFKMNNFRSGEKVVTLTGGGTKTTPVSPYLKIQYCADGGTSFVDGTANFVRHEGYINSNEWFIATVPLKDSFKSAEEIQKLRVYFAGIESISEDTPGELTIDYVYIGTREDLPTPAYTVTFVNEDGTVLATQLVNQGENAVYSGKTPTKTHDTGCHYAFDGWDKALTNITADTTITAIYAATEHSYTYSEVDGNSHKAACSCGYSKSEGHEWDGGSVSTAPSCTAEGVKTYTCSLCGRTKTEALSATGHTVAVDGAVAPTCTETGLTEGSHCSVCNLILVAQIVVPANGHSYTSKVTVPTCTNEGYTTYTCSNCDDSYTESIPATGHTEVAIPAVAATCTATGLTEGKVCSVCGVVTVEQTVIAALEHAYDGVVTTQPTCTSAGVMTYICANDASHTYTEPIEKLLHNDANSDGLCDGCHCNTNAETQNIMLDFSLNAESNILHEAVFEDIPADLLRHAVLTDVTADTDLGTATILDNTTLHFAPAAMISEIVRLNCKVEITKDGSKYYRLIPVNIVPATAAYYETDFAEGIFNLVEPPRESIAEHSFLYFDFKNSEADQERYEDPIYGGYNFDVSNWATSVSAGDEAYCMNHAEGTVSVPVVGDTDSNAYYGPYFGTTKDSGSYPWNNRPEYAPLSYPLSSDTVIKIRFKVSGCTEVSSPRLYLLLHYTDSAGEIQHSGSAIHEAFFNTENEYQTHTFKLSDYNFKGGEILNSVAFRFRNINGGSGGEVSIDYIYAGSEADFAITRAEYNQTWQTVTDGTDAANDDQASPIGGDAGLVYGYDRVYENDSKLSNGSSLYVEGVGIPLIAYKTDENGAYILDDGGERIPFIDYTSVTAYTEANFTFIGTGFDIISRTGQDQGTIRAVVLNSSGSVVKNVLVNCKGMLELYQIPVLSIHDLTYGTYTVKIFVNMAFDYGNDGNADIFGGAMDRGGEFYFDAVRIYNPINTKQTHGDGAYAYALYQAHGEADPTLTELRDILIHAGNFTAGSTVNGVVYLDAIAKEGTDFDDEDGKLTQAVAEYKEIGPNNEVYLSSGNAIAFKLEVDGTIPASIDIGAKSVDGTEVSMSIGITTTVPTTLPVGSSRRIQTGTALFYPMEILESQWQTGTADNGDTRYVYVTIYNSGTEGILSITDIKYAYDFPNPDEPVMRKLVRFVVDQQMLDIYANPCNHTWDQGEITTAPTCTAQGVKTYTCTACGSSYTETVPALGHSYINGVCSCGQAEVQEPIQETSWKLNHSLNLASDISVNLVVPKTLLEGFDMATVYVESTLETYEGNIKTGTKTIRVEPVDNGYFYYFTLDGLTAVQMNDKISSVLYGTKNGQAYYSPVDEYSIATYAYAQLYKTEISENLKTLCADLLRYGAKAQIFKAYRTDSLADAAMIEEHKAYLSDIEAVTFGNTNKVLDDLKNAPITWAGKSLNLESKVALKFVFDPATYAGELSELTLKISYTDIHGADKTLTLEDPELYIPDRMLYAFTLDALLAAELRAVVSVQILAGDAPVSCTLQYSADTYGNNKTGNLLELCKALFAYSDSAKAYFSEG